MLNRFVTILGAGILFGVRWLKTLVGLVLLAAWLPATSLCLIERAGWLAYDDCCPSSSPKSQDNDPSRETTCCALASAPYKADNDDGIKISAPTTAVLPSVDLTTPHDAPGAPKSAPVSPSPPELPTSWQFTFRTALPPRAPSFVS